jgi:hypothetical protein
MGVSDAGVPDYATTLVAIIPKKMKASIALAAIIETAAFSLWMTNNPDPL